MIHKSREQEIDFLIELLTYVSEKGNLEKVLMVIGNALEAKYVNFSYSKLTDEEATNPVFSEFKHIIATRVDNNTEVMNFSRSNNDWESPCYLAYGIMAAFAAMGRNNVLSDYSEASMDNYKKFIQLLKKSFCAGNDAILQGDEK
jgi:hypothetical protein